MDPRPSPTAARSRAERDAGDAVRRGASPLVLRLAFLLAALLGVLLAAPLGGAGWSAAQSEAEVGNGETRWRLELTVDGDPAPWSALPPSRAEGGALIVPAGTERAAVGFAGGRLDLALGDLGVWDEAHVVAVRAEPTSDAAADGWREYRFDTTVRHADGGWEHYAELWRVVAAEEGAMGGGVGSAVENAAENGVENGVRELLHPHVEEQPFTRSLTGVRARGAVWIEARDSQHGFGGSRIGLDLAASPPRTVAWSASRGGEPDR